MKMTISDDKKGAKASLRWLIRMNDSEFDLDSVELEDSSPSEDEEVFPKTLLSRRINS